MRQADQLFLNIMTAVDQDNREAFEENFLELRDHLLEGWEPPVVQSLGMVGNRPKEIMPCYSIDCAIMSRVVGVTPQSVVEVETRGDRVCKVLVRLSFGHCDLCMPLIIRTRMWFAKTLWLNHKEDNHHTLNRAAYATC